MKKILLLGAGRSASTLIKYLNEEASEMNWQITVVDADLALLERKLSNFTHCIAKSVDIREEASREKLLEGHDFVISLLPWTLHSLVAVDCIRLSRPLLTASYVNEEMRLLSDEAHSKGLFFMGEMGLDPGIDHMSAMVLIDQIRKDGGEIIAFHSYAGGLIAKESDTNPWHYKFTWNPRNIILAGQGTAQFMDRGKLVLQPYPRMFENAFPLEINGDDRYEVYANRDSLPYRQILGLEDIPGILRGTVRVRGFSKAWHALIKLGLTESQTHLMVVDSMQWFQLMDALLPVNHQMSLLERCADFLGLSVNDPVMDQLKWLGIFEDRIIGPPGKALADYLQFLLEDKWQLEEGDKDLVVMEHRITYRKDGTTYQIISTMEYEGKDETYTAMSDLVGLPLGVTCKLFFLGKLPPVTKPIPVEPGIYLPVLELLKHAGVKFNDRKIVIEQA